MKYSILGKADDRNHIDDWYIDKKASFNKLQKRRSIIWRVFIYWISALLILFLLFAYRPQVTDIESSKNFLSGLHVYRSDGAPGADGQSVVLQNQSGLRDFTEYLARTTGLIPAACAVSERTVKVPLLTPVSGETDAAGSTTEERPGAENVADEVEGLGPDQPADDTLVDEDSSGAVAKGAVAPEATVPPFPLSMLLGENFQKDFGACRWRNEPVSIAAAFSPFVGTVQKLTLFLLILGWVLVRRGSMQIDLDALCFPGRSKSDAWRKTRDQQVELMMHPALTAGGAIGRIHPLYPTLTLFLDDSRGSEAGIVEYKNDVYSTRIAVAENQLRQPFDLILNVLASGVKHRRVGPMADRIASAIFDFRERVSSRFWFVDYILWLLPTIGFLGTIYGISVSLVRAKGLFDEENDFSQVIRQVVDGLGVAFDTTSMALICSAILYLSLRRTEAKIGTLVDRAEETLTELLVGSFEDTRFATTPGGGPSNGAGLGKTDGDDLTEDDEPSEGALDEKRIGE